MIQWSRIASDLGYKDEGVMWRELYSRYSISQLCMRFAVSANTVRKELVKHNVKIRERGGPNSQKVILDADMIQAIKLRGVLTVAKERDLDPTTIYKQLRKAGLGTKAEPLPARSEEPATPGDPDGEVPEDPSRSR
jgi:hypothetical protein